MIANLKTFAAATAMTLAMGAAGSAQAVSYLMTLTNAHSSLPSPYGQVDVVQFGANTLQYTVTLFSGLGFVDTGSHHAFAFSLAGAPAVAFSGPSGFGFVQTTNNVVNNSPFRGFDYGVTCTNTVGSCRQSTGGYLQPLVFTVQAAGLTTASIATADPYNGSPVLFAADAIRNGGTGSVGGGTLITTPVPEPATWTMMIAGFGGAGVLLRRRRRNALAA